MAITLFQLNTWFLLKHSHSLLRISRKPLHEMEDGFSG
ncbi:hypothetical protein BREVNS_1250 [Brevinematales bacterium NS]|nr:hypothetical protein BREVNS_1250 [Brevinematales bacterium NS]